MILPSSTSFRIPLCKNIICFRQLPPPLQLGSDRLIDSVGRLKPGLHLYNQLVLCSVSSGFPSPTRILPCSTLQPPVSGLPWYKLISFAPSRILSNPVSHWQSDRLPRGNARDLPTDTCCIYVHGFRTSIGLPNISAFSPTVTTSDAIAVRHASGLPSTSFRFRFATDTLAVWLSIPLAELSSGLAPPSYPTTTTCFGIAPVKALRAMPSAQTKAAHKVPSAPPLRTSCVPNLTRSPLSTEEPSRSLHI